MKLIPFHCDDELQLWLQTELNHRRRPLSDVLVQREALIYVLLHPQFSMTYRNPPPGTVKLPAAMVQELPLPANRGNAVCEVRPPRRR